MIVRELIALFGFKVDKKSEGGVEDSIQRVIKGAKALGTALVAGAVTKQIIDIVEGTAKLGDELLATSQRLGVATKDLQELRFAGELANVSSEELGTGLRSLARNAFEAANGNKEAGENFRRLGVNVKGADGKVRPVSDLMIELADRFKNMSNATERTALAQKVFGRSGAALLPLLTQGSAELRRQREEAQALGGVMDDDLIALSDEYSDNQVKMSKAILGVKIAITKALLPAFNRSIAAVVEWFKANGAMLRQNVTAFFEKAARVVGAITRAISAVIDAIFDWVKSLSSVQLSFLKIGLLALGLAIALALPGGAIILLGVLIGLLLEDFFKWRDGGVSVIGTLMASFDQFLMQFPVLREALFAIGEFFSTIFATMRDVTFSFVQFWIDMFTVGPLEAVQNLGRNLLMSFEGVFNGIESMIVTAVEFWKGILVGFARSVAEIPIVAQLLRGGQAIAGALGGLLGGGGAVAPTAVATGRPSNAMSNSQTNTIDVKVDATGASQPEEIGVAVARQVELVLERQNRDALGALSVAAPATP